MKDLTVGKPMKVIWLFAVPMILGQIAQQLYSFTDSAIVGNYVSSQALAAVGATSVISNMIIGFLNSGTMGLAIPIAKYYGAKDYHNMRRCIGASAIMTLLASIVLTVLSLIFIRPILVLLKTPDDILDMAASYVIIIIVGIIFCSLSVRQHTACSRRQQDASYIPRYISCPQYCSGSYVYKGI